MHERTGSLVARRLVLWTVTVATVAVLESIRRGSAKDPWSGLALGESVMFVLLTTWVALWFWIAVTGFILSWRAKTTRQPVVTSAVTPEPPPASRTAIAIPIYNEQPLETFARVRAMALSLQATGREADFDFFLLSDTTKPELWVAEHREWLRLTLDPEIKCSIFYRRRAQNTKRKAGNIQDFCEGWGASYEYMVVLDADSLMEGSTFVALMDRVDADPAIGILQTPVLPLGDRSILSRCQQFASRLSGQLLAEGIDWYSGDGGNYWGHNAIIRLAPFMRHCGLAPLPGRPPLGGEILSHDFVEAALMRRAGYKVRLACDLTSSYEYSPTTLPAFAIRDQRWCQGNLQHAKLLFGGNIRWTNRFHFFTGIMSYLGAPLWGAFLLYSLLLWSLSQPPNSTDGVDLMNPASGVFLTVMVMLLLPRLLGAILAARREGLQGFGGAFKLAQSIFVEFLASVLMAPLMMTFHSLFVAKTLMGQRVEWHAQNRGGDGVSWSYAWKVHRWQMFIGLAGAAAIALLAPHALIWFSPIIVSLLLAVPTSVALSSPSLGAYLMRRRLLLVPEEGSRPAIIQGYAHSLEALSKPDPLPAPQVA